MNFIHNLNLGSNLPNLSQYNFLIENPSKGVNLTVKQGNQNRRNANNNEKENFANLINNQILNNTPDGYVLYNAIFGNGNLTFIQAP